MKKNILLYFCVYGALTFVLLIPFIFGSSQSIETINTNYVITDDKTTIELIADDMVVGIIQQKPGSKIEKPVDTEFNVNNYSNVTGWYTDKSYQTRFNFDYQPETNQKAYAKLEGVDESNTDPSVYLFWGVALLSAIGLGVLFFVLNRYYSKQNKSKTNNK